MNECIIQIQKNRSDKNNKIKSTKPCLYFMKHTVSLSSADPSNAHGTYRISEASSIQSNFHEMWRVPFHSTVVRGATTLVAGLI